MVCVLAAAGDCKSLIVKAWCRPGCRVGGVRERGLARGVSDCGACARRCRRGVCAVKSGHLSGVVSVVSCNVMGFPAPDEVE